MPIIMASAVMITGRMRTKPASTAASAAFLPSAICSRAKDTIKNTVRRGHAHAHDSAGEGRHVQGGVGDQEHPADARQRSRQRSNDDERIKPRLKIHDDQQVRENDRAGEADAETEKGIAHGLNLTANHDVAASGQLVLIFDGFHLLEDLIGYCRPDRGRPPKHKC